MTHNIIFHFCKVRRASSLLNEALEGSKYTEAWNDKKGYKCSPPILTGANLDKENDLLDKIKLDIF